MYSGKKLLEKHFQNIDLDVRKTRIGTFMDQKVTPDVLSAIAECAIELLGDDHGQVFDTKDLRNSEYSNNIVTGIFSKPDVGNAPNEYDKFFAQPIKMLAYAKVLDENEDKRRPYIYTVNNRELLEYISLRDRNALKFIQFYINKLIADCGLDNLVDDFLTKQDGTSFENLKSGVTTFYTTYTPKNGKTEISRIFTKIINPLSFEKKKRGTRKGRISDTEITFDELCYNRINWRDYGKNKSLTRQEAKELFAENDNQNYFNYSINKAKRLVKHLHQYSEIHRFESHPGTHAHHIFMEKEFPEIAYYPENIIVVTPNQHLIRAHPNNKTSTVDESYQIVCLLAKLDSIEMNRNSGKDDYFIEQFVHVLNTGYGTDYFKSNMSYEELKHSIVRFKIANHTK